MGHLDYRTFKSLPAWLPAFPAPAASSSDMRFTISCRRGAFITPVNDSYAARWELQAG